VSKALSPWFGLSLCTFGYLYATSNTALAQVTSDGTVNTQVNQNGNVAEITGGQTRGGNLFHSFRDFSVRTGDTASFLNSNDIANIFSRVTGGNISNINGLIKSNGSANLFLINPAGILFGENARLDVGGSFLGSTADSVLFEDGEFSAVNNLNQPILTINAPIGLGLRDQPADIVNRSVVQNSAEEVVGLEVNPGNNLAFVGGNIRLDRGNLTAKGGNIELGGLTEAGIVSINEDGSLSFPENVTKADINLSNGADVDVRGAGGGSVTVNARNLTLTAGEFGSSSIRAGIRPKSTNPEAQAGDVTINVAQKITLIGSGIFNQVYPEGVGNSGNIAINTGSLEAINGGFVDASTLGQGNAGTVNVTTTEDMTLDGQDSGGIPSGITSLVNSGTTGSSGGITITTSNLNLTKGGRVDASTGGQGNAGAVNVTATGDITADGETSDGSPSGISSQVNPDAVGDSGGVTITTTNLNLTNGGRVSATTGGQGNAGAVDITATGDITADGETSDGLVSNITSLVNTNTVGNAGGITITTTNLNLTNGGQVNASTFGQGNAGAVNVTASGDITADGETSDGFSSGIASVVNPGAEGDAGGVTISTSNLTLTKGGEVDASTFGQGDAGEVNITATGDIIADGETSDGFPSGIASVVNPGAEGDAGGVTISTSNLTLTKGGEVDASTFGQGDAGEVNITATGDIIADGETSDGFPSGITSGVDIDAVGDAGGVTITTTNLNLTNGGQVNASTEGRGNAGAVDITASNLTLTNGGQVAASTGGQGNAGLINITATEDITADGEDSQGFPSSITSQVISDAKGNAGGVTITTTNLKLTNGGWVDASTNGQGDAGLVKITASGDITVDGGEPEGFPGGISSQVATDAVGNSEGVTITTSNLKLTNGGWVDASTRGQGNAGAVNVTATGDITADGEDSVGLPSGITSLVDTGAVGNAGGVTITTSNLKLINGGRVDASTFGNGNAGVVDVTATESIFINGSISRFRSGISANALNEDGNGGNVFVKTGQLTIENGGTIEATNFDNIRGNDPGTGKPGNIFIEADNLDLADQGRIEAATQSPTGESGEIALQVAEDITLKGNSFISAQAFDDANGGNLTIDARFIVAFSSNGIGNDLVAAAEQGKGGNIDLDAEQIFGLETGEAINDEGDFIPNNNNNIDASSDVFGLDGTVNINTSGINPVQGATELPSNVVEPEQTTDQACQADRETEAKNGLVINGKGGIPAPPDQPLTSQNLLINGEVTSAQAIPEPIETSQGKIQLARGIKFTKDGGIILTPYPTNNAGERIPEIKPNCI
jgi:filamentous hemagglutinin family protein